MSQAALKNLAGQSVTEWNAGKSEKVQARFDRVVTLLQQAPMKFWQEPTPPKLEPLCIIRRPESELIKCRVIHDTQVDFCFIKFHRALDRDISEHNRALGRIKQEAQVTQNFFQHFEFHSSFGVPKVVAFFPEEMAVVTKEIPGRRLLDVLREEAVGFPTSKVREELSRHFRLIGGWLAEFQGVALGQSSELDDPSQHIVPYVTIRLDKLIQAGMITESFVRKICDFLHHHMEACPRGLERACQVHGDLSLSNVFLTPGYVGVLDFAMSNVSNVYEDLSYFYQRLDNLRVNPLFRNSTICAFQQAFLEGYGNPLVVNHHLFKAYQVRHTINHLVDLSKSDGLSTFRRVYQLAQFYWRVDHLKYLIRI
jgi:tRNA A-37 threonylcarbamoyl transferase component Bud32